jgi:uncharacterized membrane protein
MPMKEVEKHVDVNVPVHTAYNQWTQFESFPHFMEGVEEVRQLDDRRLHWRARVGGEIKEWDAIINEQQPDRVIAWHSTSGAENAGRVAFTSLGDSVTRVSLHMGYHPESFVENVGDWFGAMGRQLEGDLHRYKEFIESRGAASGGWRGEIHHGETQRSG